jgi:hypothetical protein
LTCPQPNQKSSRENYAKRCFHTPFIDALKNIQRK